MPSAVSPVPDYPITPVAASAGDADRRFWAPKLEINRRVTIPHIMRAERDDRARRQFPQGGAADARRLHRAPLQRHRRLQGHRGGVVVAEGAPGSGARQEGRRSHRADRRVAGARRLPLPARTIDPKNPAPGVGPERWIYENGSHELYNCRPPLRSRGRALPVDRQATLLDVAIKNADLVAATFGPPGAMPCPATR